MRGKLKFKFFLILFSSFLGLYGCQKGPLLFDNIELFRGIWPLAQAVNHQDLGRIESLAAEHPGWINQHEPKFGETILMWAVVHDKYDSVQKLLELKADPNLQDFEGTSAMMYASAFQFGPKYVKLLLKFGGDVNAVAKPQNQSPSFINFYQTPLIATVDFNNLESMKVLVNAGADINFHYNDKRHPGVLFNAFILKQVDMVMYLMFEKHAQFKDLGIYGPGNRFIGICECLQFWDFPVGSENYKKKAIIIDYLRSNGMNCP